MPEFEGVPRKLNDGTWGACVFSDSVASGDLVQVAPREGEPWTAVVTRVLWSGDGKAIARVSRRPHRSPPREPYRAEPATTQARPMAPPVGDRSDKPNWVKNW